MMKALRVSRSRYNSVSFLNASFLTRSIAHPYHSIPADDYPPANYYPDGNGDAYCSSYDPRNDGYFDWNRRSCGDEFGGFRPGQSTRYMYDSPYWRSYRFDCPYGEEWWVEGYPNWGNELCPSCRAASYWGRDVSAPHWVNGDARWNQQNLDVYGLDGREWNVHPSPPVDVGMPYYYGEHFNPDIYICRPNICRPNTGNLYDERDRELLGGVQPMNSDWRSGQYPQTYQRKYDGMHWNETASGWNRESQNVHGLHGHDQNPSASRMKPNMSYEVTSSVPYGNGGTFQGNGSRHLNVIREGGQQSLERYERRNESNCNQPQSYTSEQPNRSNPDNTHGFQKISAEHRNNFNYGPEPGRQQYSQYNEFRGGRVLDKHETDSKNNASANSDYKENRDGGRQGDVKDCDFLEDIQSPTLNAALSDEGPEVLNSGNQIKNLEQEQVRGSVDELENFTKEGKLMLAVKVLDVMEKKNYHLDPERDLSKIKMLIQACGDSKAITEAKAVHKHIVNLMSPLKFSLYNKILRMYLKCGAVSDACSMFYSMAAHNVTTWDTMIKGLVKNNLGEEALDLFAEFKNTDSEPDGPMFLGVFSACRVVGDVIEGMLHFESMTKQYGIIPSMKHYVCIVDMMGRIGHLDEAMEFIERMPVKPSVDVWETMMNVCRIHGNTELGDRCAKVVGNIDPSRLSDESKAGLVFFR